MKNKWSKRIRSMSRDLGYCASLVLGIIVLSFLLFQAFPGDPARLTLGPGASEAAVENLRQKWGLDRPLPARLVDYVGGVVRLDLGTTYRDEQSVSRLVMEKFQVTASIGLRAAALALAVSYFVHLIAWMFPAMRWLPSVMAAAVAVPSFLVAILGGLLLATLVPAIALSGRGGDLWTEYSLPVVILAIYPMALMTRVLGRKIVEGRGTLYFQSQEAAGFSRAHLFHRCLLRPAAVSWLAVLFNQLSLLFLATMIVEIIFTIPGSGKLLAQAVQRSDFPLIQGILVFNGVFFILLLFFSEQVYRMLLPAGTGHERRAS